MPLETACTIMDATRLLLDCYCFKEKAITEGTEIVYERDQNMCSFFRVASSSNVLLLCLCGDGCFSYSPAGPIQETNTNGRSLWLHYVHSNVLCLCCETKRLLHLGTTLNNTSDPFSHGQTRKPTTTKRSDGQGRRWKGTAPWRRKRHPRSGPPSIRCRSVCCAKGTAGDTGTRPRMSSRHISSCKPLAQVKFWRRALVLSKNIVYVGSNRCDH